MKDMKCTTKKQPWARIVSPNGRSYPVYDGILTWIKVSYHMKKVMETLPENVRKSYSRKRIVANFCYGLSSYRSWRGWELIVVQKEEKPLEKLEPVQHDSEPTATETAPVPAQRKESGLIRIENFIREVRDSFIGAEHVYMNGSCFYFARMLRAIYGGTIVENHSHCYLELRGKYYDIRGEVTPSTFGGGLRRAKEPTLHGKYNLITNSN